MGVNQIKSMTLDRSYSEKKNYKNIKRHHLICQIFIIKLNTFNKDGLMYRVHDESDSKHLVNVFLSGLILPI